jgi:capsular exopolysaccharide synthesis family protein
MADQTEPGPSWQNGDDPEAPVAAVSAPRTYGGSNLYAEASFGKRTARAEADPDSELIGRSEFRQIHLMDFVRSIYKHRWIALTTFAVLFLGTAIRTFTTTPIYEGRVQLLLDPANPNVMKFEEVTQSSYLFEQYFYQTQVNILKSRGLARRTIQALNLWNTPEFGGGQEPSEGMLGRLNGALSASKAATAGLAAGETERQSRVIDTFLEALTIAPIRNSSLVNVRFESRDPATAALVANALAKQYIDQNLEYKFLSTKEASDWLGSQLAAERKRLEESEQALQRYRETGDAVALEDRQNIVVQRLADLNAAYTQARTERFEKEALYNQLKNLQADRTALDTFPAILSNAFIQQLKAQLADLQRQQAQMGERLGEKHPDMLKLNSAIANTESRLQGEIGKVVQSVRNEYLSAEAKERSLAAELAAQKAGALSLNKKGIEYGVLRREAESNKQMYEALLQRARETGVSSEMKTSNIRIVDPAEVPRTPVRPRKAMSLFLGLFAGIVSGVALAFFVEYIDNRVKSPDEIKQYLGLSYLGLVPAVREEEGADGRSPLISEPVVQNFAEAFREIRTSVMFSSVADGARSVLITSTEPSEGKSIVAANLAVSFAHAGLRVLLMDADMRKPRLHSLMKLKQDPGLSSLLVGRAKANEVVLRSGTPNLWVMPAGPNPPNPAELLGSTRFANLMSTVRDHFDWIVVDSPPVMAVTDPSVMAHLATGVVFVIGSEQVSRHKALTAVQKLQASKGKILGAVLNRVNVQRNPYYYSHYYSHEYAGYYSREKKA